MLRIEYAEITTCYEFFLRVPCVESLHDQVLQSNVTVRKLVKKKKSIQPHLILVTLTAQVTFRGSIGAPSKFRAQLT